MFQKAIVLLISVSLVFADVVPRSTQEDIMDSTRITKIPFGFYKEKMEKGMYKVVDKEDLALYPGKRIFAGYGIFDVGEKTCKYVENSANKLTFINDFEKVNVFNNNTFAISRSSMTYPQCVSLTQKYIGRVYAPKSLVEEDAVSRGYFLEDEMWVGMQRSACDSDYLNMDGVSQTYNNFLYDNEPCSTSKANVVKIADATGWIRRSSSETHKCPIRIDTNDYLKPIKICAPWWRIESNFINKNKETLIWGGREISLDNFLMPDVPQRVNVCTERKVLKSDDNNGTKNVTCKKYFSRLAGNGNSGQCLEFPIQPSCEINECEGYIENNCKKIRVLEPFKDYTWDYMTINGEKKRVKKYDKIRTYVYECPAVNPNENNCLRREELVVFPKECPGSKCEQLRSCIQSNSHTQEYCKTTYPCEKIYGDSDLIPVYVSGRISALRAKCSDGTVIENNQIREQTYSKTDCIKYDEIVEVNTTIEKCISIKNKTLHEVNTTITDADIYANNPDCVRTNNIEDSRPYVDAVFNYTNRGFFTTIIQKAYIDGESNETEDFPDIANQLPYQIENIRSETISSEPSSTIDGEDEGIVTVAECEAYFVADGWFGKRITSLFEHNSIVPIGILHSYPLVPDDNTTDSNSSSDDNTTIPTPHEVPKLAIVVKSVDCDNAASLLGYTNIAPDIYYSDYPFSKLGINSNSELRGLGLGSLDERYCVLNDSPLGGDDIIRFIEINSSSEELFFSTEDFKVDENQCMKYSACLGLDISDSYMSDSEIKACQLSTEAEPEPIDFNPADGNYTKFVETNGTIATTLDGTKDMIVLQEYAPGRFGYMSNYRFQLPKNNIIRLNNREIFPLIPNAPINEELSYDFDIYSLKQTTKNRSPSSFTPYFETLSFGALDPSGSAGSDNNYGAAAVAGGAAGGIGIAAGLSSLSATGVGVVVAVVFLLLAGNKRYGMIRTHWNINKELSEEVPYVSNPYGYDFREYNATTRTFTYERTKFQMAMQKRGTFEKVLGDYNVLKKISLNFAGYSDEQIDTTLIRSCERDGCVNYPGKVKWYKFSGKNSNSSTDNGPVTINKPVNTIYMGATNTVVVFVPYEGDYEMVALDRNKNILGSKVVTRSDFISGNPYTHPFAKVMFSLSNQFALAEGINYGTNNNACVYDDFAEWGGGVSGVYYESGTPNSHRCQKSNDSYVKDNSAYYLKFRPVDSDKYFEVRLKKPMPFANRFYFVNLGKMEIRKYECYEAGEPCQP